MGDDIRKKIDELQAAYQSLGDSLADARARIGDARREDREIKRARHRSASAYNSLEYPEYEERLRNKIDRLMERRDAVRDELVALRAQARTQHSGTDRRYEQVDDSPRLTGTVKWFRADRGYGFISVAGEPDVYVPVSSIRDASVLEAGDVVTFKRTASAKGHKAVDVRHKPA